MHHVAVKRTCNCHEEIPWLYSTAGSAISLEVMEMTPESIHLGAHDKEGRGLG